MDIVPYILPFLTGGVAVYGLQQWAKKGKTYLSDYSLVISYHIQGGRNIIDKYILDLQFTNTSGHTKRINFLGIDFTVGAEEIDLSFDGQPYPPAYILKEKEAASYHNELIATSGKVGLPIAEIAFNECIFRVRYSINDKLESFIINPSVFKLKDTTINVAVG